MNTENNCASNSTENHRLLQRWMMAFLLVGVGWRALRYFLRFPIWGDEAFVCLNFLDRDFLGLTRMLKHSQVAPLLFLWGELLAFRLLGASELALRLLPFLAGTGALILYWRLSHRILSPLAATLAVGFLAVAIWPVSMCSFVKPYSLDLLMALALLTPAVCWLEEPGRSGWLAVLALVAPVAILASYPAIFIAAGVSLALVAKVWSQSGWKVRSWYVVFNLLTAACFLGHYWFVGTQQSDPVGGAIGSDMQSYWAEGFPPLSPLPLVRWLLLIHTGQMLAYPVGAANGGSILTTLLVLGGAWHFWKSGKKTLLALLLAPFALGLLAAALHSYPYGASGRLSQHVAPAICLLAGAGGAHFIERARSESRRRSWTIAACGLLLLVGFGGMMRDLLKPSRSQSDDWTRKVILEVITHAGRDDQIVVLNAPNEVKPMFEWYLEQHGARVAWQGQIDFERLDANQGRLWCLFFSAPIDKSECSAKMLAARDASLRTCRGIVASVSTRLCHLSKPRTLEAHVPYTIVPTDGDGPIERCDVYRWVASEKETGTLPVQALSCWP